MYVFFKRVIARMFDYYGSAFLTIARTIHALFSMHIKIIIINKRQPSLAVRWPDNIARRLSQGEPWRE